MVGDGERAGASGSDRLGGSPAGSRLVGVDVKETMLARAAVEVERRGPSGVELRVMDAEDLRYEDSSFEGVFCAFAFSSFANKPKAPSSSRARVLACRRPSSAGSRSGSRARRRCGRPASKSGRGLRVARLTDVDAHELVEGGKAGELVRGFRGRPAVDGRALTDLLHCLARITEDLPEIAELDLNPVLASGDGCVAVDARIRVAPAQRLEGAKSW